MYNVGIIGLGNIAMGYGTPEDEAPYTHVGGIHNSDCVSLAAVADLSEEAYRKFNDKWEKYYPDTPYYKSVDDMLSSENLDIVSVCIRGPFHFQVMMEVLKAKPKAIFLEKPPTCSLDEMDRIVEAAKLSNVPITVSYSRHWGSHVVRMAELIHKENLIGEVKSVVGYCGHSVLSFAIHTTDMICQFANYSPKAVYARGKINNDQDVPDGYEKEPTLDGMIIEFDNGVIGTQIGHNGEHGGFYCDVFAAEGRARIPFYDTAFAWDKDSKPIDLSEHGIPAPESPFKIAYEQIARNLDGGELPDCTDEHFIAVNEIGFGAIESILTNKRIELPNTNRNRLIYANG